MRLSVVATCLCCCLIGFSAADDAHASIRKFTNIPTEGLGPALQTLAKDRNFQIVFVSEDLANVRTPGAIGEFTPEEALKRLLTGTGLTYKYLDDKTVTIVPSAPPATAAAADQNNPSSNARDASKEAGKKSSQDFRVAQVDQKAVGPQAVEKNKGEQSDSKKKTAGLEEVVVTGTRIPTVAGQLTFPVLSYTREDIEQSGQTTLADFFNTLPDVSTSFGEGPTQTFAGLTTVSLHGLPIGTTLILLNGRRVETSIRGFFDLGNIPISAIERVEVLPVGASSIYGADALGGAINIILRKNFSGFEASAKFGHADGLDDTGGNFGWGESWERGGISFIGTYQTRGELVGAERAATSSTNYFPANASAGDFTDACSPGNVYSLNGQNLPGLSSPAAGIPAGISGTPTRQQFAATAGKLNKCNSQLNDVLIPPAQREGGLLSGHYQITASADLFTETLLSHQVQNVTTGPLISASGGSYGATVLGANNPYNPFGEAVGASFYYPGIQSTSEDSETLIRPLIGVRGSVLSGWDYEVTAYLSHDRFAGSSTSLDPNALQTALNSSSSATALNPFTASVPGTPQLLQSLTASAIQSPYFYDNQLVDVQAMLRGPLLRLPAGPLETVIGSEYSQAKQDSYFGYGSPLDLQRRTYALFTEAHVPLLAERERPQGGDRLALTFAGRYDHSNDFGGKATWQSGLLWRPTETLSLRGSYAVSYMAPSLYEIGGGGVTYPGNYNVDPFRGGESFSANYVYGSNPNLKAETGDSRSLGIVYSSQALSGFEASLTYFAINISNYIGQPATQTIIDNPNLYPGGVIREPTTPQDERLGFLGPIVQVNDIYFNFGALRVAGLDVNLRYTMDTDIGQFAPSVSLTDIGRWQSALVPGSPAISYLSQATFNGPGFAPRWKGTAALGWKQGPLSANFDGRYVGPYKDYQDFVPNSNELGNFWVFDFNIRYEAGNALAGNNPWLSGTYVAMGAANLFDKTPPFSYGVTSYDYAEYDIRGRFVYVQVGIKFK
jgi:iron complex outermembrane recepter protein